MVEVLVASAPGAIERAAAALRAAQLIALPTETVYGLAVLPLDNALALLVAAKRRSTEKGIQLLVDSLDQARAVALLSSAAERLAKAFWPGGLTLVVERRPDCDLPSLLGGGRPTLGIRLPDHAVPRALAKSLGPLAASSANVSGHPPATDAAMVLASLGGVLSVVLDDGPVRGGVASTVLDCSAADGRVRILREGAVTSAEIIRVVGQDYTAG
jgi:L-threonylcarbamoyladenylate synthase